MSSKVDIVVNVHSEEANKNVDQLDENIKKAKNDAEKPAKIKLDTDEAKKSAKGLGDALQNVKDTGLGELSQKASEFGRSLGGVFGDITEIALKSAASFGPLGIAITGIGAALALVVQYQKEMEVEAGNSAGLAQIQRNLGSAYGEVERSIRSAKDSTEALSIAIRTQQELIRNTVTLLNSGYNTTQIDAFRASGEALISTCDPHLQSRQNIVAMQIRKRCDFYFWHFRE
jgi:hypothetical protein